MKGTFTQHHNNQHGGQAHERWTFTFFLLSTIPNNIFRGVGWCLKSRPSSLAPVVRQFQIQKKKPFTSFRMPINYCILVVKYLGAYGETHARHYSFIHLFRGFHMFALLCLSPPLLRGAYLVWPGHFQGKSEKRPWLLVICTKFTYHFSEK